MNKNQINRPNRIKWILNFLILVLSVPFMVACNGKTNQEVQEVKEGANTTKESQTEAPVENPEQKQRTFKILESSKTNISDLEYSGTIAHKHYWQDQNGENIALFTTTEEELYVFHYAVKEGQKSLLRKVYDFEKDCEFDLFIEFIPNSIFVTDLDANDLGELTFAYQKTCASDVSPKTLKLLMLEDKEKYIIRGTTEINMGGNDIIGGDKEMDPSFDGAPKMFRDHADKVWDSVVRQ